MGAFGIGERDLAIAATVREYATKPRPTVTFNSIRIDARNLEEGFRVFLKYDNGKNLCRAFDNEISSECRKLEIEAFEISDAITTLAAYCVAHDKYSAETGWEFEARLDALNIELSDLIKLSREERCRLSPTNPEALKLIDELARFQAVQKDLKSYSFAVQFQGEPLDGMAVNRPVMISRIHREGYTIDLLEGALAMVKDRTIKPTIMKNVVSVESLMQALGY